MSSRGQHHQRDPPGASQVTWQQQAEKRPGTVEEQGKQRDDKVRPPTKSRALGHIKGLQCSEFRIHQKDSISIQAAAIRCYTWSLAGLVISNVP